MGVHPIIFCKRKKKSKLIGIINVCNCYWIRSEDREIIMLWFGCSVSHGSKGREEKGYLARARVLVAGEGRRRRWPSRRRRERKVRERGGETEEEGRVEGDSRWGEREDGSCRSPLAQESSPARPAVAATVALLVHSTARSERVNAKVV